MNIQQKMYSFIKRALVILTVLACVSGVIYAQEKADALKLYRTGRSLDSAGRAEEAKASYTAAVSVCLAELRQNPRNMDSYTVYTWSLFRLHRYRETVAACNEALKIASDVRIIETLGEAHFYLNDYKESLRQMERYIDMAPTGERASVAYFYTGDIYRLTKRYQKADIAYSAAVHLEPSNSLWWYRLGLAREQAGDKRSAREAFQRALNIRKDYKEAAEGLARVQL
ncbi:tetratricopeptide repeat protein [Treponema sp. OMZ 305]|nr:MULTISPECIES: tetratricopeptide repeat protein [Treponema]QUY18648.1 tetratricopeptide repeat protein [Treponema vincentii]UTC58540.1 tetratricopeptide repeat protein [Treponema sp. OMZ 305]